MRMHLNMSLCLFLLSATSLLPGCSGRWSPAVTSPITPLEIHSLRDVRSYELGTGNKAAIGQPMLRVKTFHQGDFVKEVVAPKSLQIKARYRFTPFSVKVSAQDRIPISDSMKFSTESWQSNTGDTHFIAPVTCSSGLKWGLLVSREGRVAPYCMYSYTYQMMYCSYSMEVDPDYVFKVVAKQMDTRPYGSYELLFSGRNENSLNTTYREFTGDDMAPGAFFQNPTYQPDARQIRFKNFVIQVKDATNEQITYSIITDNEQ